VIHEGLARRIGLFDATMVVMGGIVVWVSMYPRRKSAKASPVTPPVKLKGPLSLTSLTR